MSRLVLNLRGYLLHVIDKFERKPLSNYLLMQYYKQACDIQGCKYDAAKGD
jgi:hypothetical protein